MQPSVLDPVFPPIESEEDMPLNETDKAWVREYVRTVHQRQGWGKLTGFIKDWSGTSAAIGILLFFVTQWGGYTEFKTHTGDKLIGIEGRLDKIDNDLLEVRASQFPESVLHEINGLEQAKFVEALPALRTVVAQTPEGAKTSPALLGGIAEKLSRTSPESPGYWPTVLQFLQFASAGLSSAGVPPPGPPNVRIANNRGIAPLGTFSHKIVLLDGGDLGSTRFDHCRIIFTENPVHMTNVQFVNSVFELPITAAPNQYIQDVGRKLLASDLRSASIPTL
jgi:hypothetical protein